MKWGKMGQQTVPLTLKSWRKQEFNPPLFTIFGFRKQGPIVNIVSGTVGPSHLA